MAATTLPSLSMTQLIEQLKVVYPGLSFKESSQASWSAAKQQVTYCAAAKGEKEIWGVLHELGHALLGHADFESDIDLLNKELQAWDKALELAKEYGIVIEQDHIQDCLDTYRDWLHKRSACPDCLSHGLQRNKGLYHCPNCGSAWRVTNDRLCRPYRLKMSQNTLK